MNKKLIISGVVLLLFVSTVCFLVFKEHPINTSSEAIEMAQKYVNEKYGQEFLSYKINAILDDDIWVVSYSEKKSNNEIIFGGGGPEVRIKQSNGRIISCMLQK